MSGCSKVTPIADKSLIPHSIASSMVSLSPSQVDAAMMDMLNLRPENKSCGSLCAGNPITTKGKRQQICRIFSVVSIPILTLICMTANTFGATLQGYMKSFEIRNVLNYSTQLGSLIHILQRERDQSALYLSMIGPETKRHLLEAYSVTDQIIEALEQWPVSSNNLLIHFQTKEKFEVYLNQHRYRLNTMNRTVAEEIGFYTDDIRIFVRWLYDSITEARSGTVWRSLVAFLEITDAKESLGLERALGATFYAKGGNPSLEDYLWFAENQDIANASFWSARQFSAIAGQFYDDLIANNHSFIDNLSEMRRKLRLEDGSNRTASLVKAELWFEAMSDYMDVLLNTQRDLIAWILMKLGEREDEDLARVIVIAVVFAGALCLCPIIIHGVYSLTAEMQSYSMCLADRTKALRHEKKRMELLLYQMIPKTVADQLKKTEGVNTEMFAEVTIFFSDVVGFTSLAAQCSPVQVIDMLNNLYRLFDDRIEQYDVYKMETIGDAYMVVSGLPQRNGKRHATEIATMALDLQKNIVNVEISHLPESSFKLRIGMHTGPVVAGVVGYKMPRYGLFGQTVTIASRMESLGASGKIHISQTTYNFLKDLGDFTMELRKDGVISRDCGLRPMMKGNLRTYWLFALEGMIRKASAHVSSDSDFSELEDKPELKRVVAKKPPKTTPDASGISIHSAEDKRGEPLFDGDMGAGERFV